MRTVDREKVVERLQRVSRYFKSMLKVGYDGDAEIYREHRESVKMAIELLKEEPRRPIILHETESYKDGKCPFCTFPVETTLYPHYCGNCGQLLKWEDDDA